VAFNPLPLSVTAEANDCKPATIFASLPAGAGADNLCSLPVAVTAVPTPGLEYFGAFCGPAATAGHGSNVKARRFGVYRWFITASSGTDVISSPTMTFTATAQLAIDAGTAPLLPGVCNYVAVSTMGTGMPAAAAANTAVTVDLSQGGIGLSNCGDGVINAGNSIFYFGVTPSATASVSVTLSGSLFPGGASATLPVCTPQGGSCASTTDCCDGRSCAINHCQ
jgi:hypothetical protein